MVWLPVFNPSLFLTFWYEAGRTGGIIEDLKKNHELSKVVVGEEEIEEKERIRSLLSLD